MNMLQFRLRLDALLRFAQAQGINRSRDEDLGYAVHALLKALFGEFAPKPFRLLSHPPSPQPQRSEGRLVHARAQHVQVLAYSNRSAEQLREQASLFAFPEAYQAWVAESLAAKTMPTAWQTGRRLGFEVLTCPVARQGEQEKDVFLRRIERTAGTDVPSRAKVYSDWLARQLNTSAYLEEAQLSAFRLIRLLRRDQPVAGQPRHLYTVQRPQALLTGVLAVADSAAFNELVARGIGRHRAFGYGMLLVRPAP